MREQQLSSPSSPPMHTTNTLHHDIDDKNFDRVHQWIAQQHKFAGLPPPDEESLFRTHSSADIGGVKELTSSSIADSHSFTDWCNNPYAADDEMYRFGGLEVNRYYSPNMTRKRGYVPRSETSLSNAQYIINSSRSSIPQLPRQHNGGDYADCSIASSSRESPIAWSPYNRYYYHSGEGNTFPRRNKINKEEKRNLFTSAIMENSHSPIRSIHRLSYSDDPFLSRNIETSLTNRKVPERMVAANQYSTASQLSNSESVEQVLDDDVINPYKAPPKYSAPTPQEVKSITEKNNSIIGSMSLDTQRLLTGNLPDVALTAAKALHKRELSDSLPKYPKGPIKSSTFQHVRMSSAPVEQTDANLPGTTTDNKSSDSNNSNNGKNIRNKNLTNCSEVRRVKAFSWPKRAMLPPSTTKELLKDEFMKNKKKDSSNNNNDTTIKTEESGYNTEKSEDKNELNDEQNDAIHICEEVLDKTRGTIDTLESIDDTLDTVSLSKESVLSGHSFTKDSCSVLSHDGGDEDNASLSKESLSKESAASDQSEQPPARPPLPSPTVYSDKKVTTSMSSCSPTSEILSESRDVIPSPASSSTLPLDSRLSNVKMRSSYIRMSSPDVRYTSSDVRLSPSDAPLRRSIAVDQLSNLNLRTPKTNDTSSSSQSQYSSIKYLKNRDLSADCTVSAFCSSTTDLTRNVSMSLKDLIRIHEQEIARVSGAHGGNSTSGRLKNHDFMRKCSISDAKARSKSVWKRHTTIGLLTSFDDEKTLLELANNCDSADKLPNNISLYNNITTTTASPSNKDTATTPTPVTLSEEISDTDILSPPYSPTSLASSGNSFCKRKRNAPLTLPKPAAGIRGSLCSLVEVETPSVPDIPTPASLDELASSVVVVPQPQIQSPTITTPSSTVSSTLPHSPLQKDVCVQTDMILLDMSQTEANETLLFAKERKELELKLEKEKQVMQRKLDEQKKVANAYQKLEDRYRRKVYELQKALHTCTCNKGKGAADTTQFVENR